MAEFLQPCPCCLSVWGPSSGVGERRKPAGTVCHDLHLGCDVLAPLTHQVFVTPRRLRSRSSTYPPLPQTFSAAKGLSGPQVKSTTEIPSATLTSRRRVPGHPGLAQGSLTPLSNWPNTPQVPPHEDPRLTRVLLFRLAIPGLLACH